jgi:hypothetical protein
VVTPAHAFDALGVRFDADIAAPMDLTHVSVPADRFITADSLSLLWSGFTWMNPPFGHQSTKRKWLTKFFDHGNGIALTPDRTSAPWFREAWRRADLLMFTPKLMVAPRWLYRESPGTGTCLWAAGNEGVQALGRAAFAGLGILATPSMEMAA